ncbi:MAG: type II toxin-antitoxin system RelE/ParE family toxin [Anaerolineae bacterium]|nr:type II toxin-antitoxin system RelE/ParE family toxin [Anaerolineae bacterium]
MYEVTYSRQAERALLRLPRHLASRIREKLDQIAVDPYAQHNNVTRLQGRPGYRLRIGDWRVIYKIQDGEMFILVLKIGPRGDVYDE